MVAYLLGYHGSSYQGRVQCCDYIYLVQDMRTNCDHSCGISILTEVEHGVTIMSTR